MSQITIIEKIWEGIVMLQKENLYKAWKIFLLPFLAWWIFGAVSIFLLQDSNVITKYISLSPRFSESILGFLIIVSFVIVWRVILSNYAKVTGNTLNKRHFLYWRFFVGIVVFSYLVYLVLLLTGAFQKNI